MRVPTFLVAVLLASAPPAAAQHPGEAGRFAVHAFAPEEYGTAPQHWALAEDARGVIYTATDGFVLAYDGARWQRIAIPNGSTARALAADARDRIFVGAQDEFGVIEADARGRPRYRSFVPLLPDSLRAFGDVRSVITTPEGAYFSTARGLFRWADAGGLRVWPLRGTSRRLGWVGGQVLVQEVERGLVRLAGDRLAAVPGGHLTAGATGARILSTGPAEALVLTRAGGLFRYAGGRLVPFATPLDARLRRAQVFEGVLLPGPLLALATLREGVFLIGLDGRLVRRLDRAAGLPDDDAKTLLYTRQGHLWIGFNNGLAAVALPGALTFFDRLTGLDGFVTGIARHEGRLFAATSTGVSVLDAGAGEGSAPHFRAVPGVPEFCHDLLAQGAELLAACDGGVWSLSPGGGRRVFAAESVLSLAASARHPGQVYAGTYHGVQVLWQDAGAWQSAPALAGLDTKVGHLAEAPDGTLWIGTLSQGLYHARLSADGRAGAARRYAPWQAPQARVFGDGSRVLVGGPEGLWQAEGDRLVRERLFQPALPAGPRDVALFAALPGGARWMQVDGRPGRLDRRGARWTWTPLPGLPLPPSATYKLYIEPDGVLWAGTAHGLMRYDRAAARPTPPPQAQIRGLLVAPGDSVRWGGMGALPATVALSAGQTALRIQYSAPGAEKALFQTFLAGIDAGWTDFSAEAQRDFTALPPGAHTFRVRAQGAGGEIGPQAVLHFTIAPPWFRTGWARSLMALLAAGGLWGVLRLNGRRLRRRTETLERLVGERTARIEGQKAMLEAQNAQIEMQAARLRVLDEAKSRFFANVSHEFRTPLTLTLGPIEDLLGGYHGPLPPAARPPLDGARRNAYKLLRLVGRLLDLAKLESGHMTLACQRADVGAFVQHLVAGFAPLATRRGIHLGCNTPGAPLLAPFDAEKLEEIVVNLVSNAIKATPAGGRIDVTVEGEEAWAEVRVADTGTGIEPDSLSVIFDRFRQGRRALPGTTGTGIGLNLVQELVHLHGGTVAVESRVGAGSVFTVRLPLSAPETGGAMPGVAGLAARAADGDGLPTPAPLDLPPPPPPPPPDGAALPDRTTILVVDDSPDVRAYVRQHLESAYRVEEAADGESGLEWARALLPDLIISDVMMPRRDGFSLCRALKADPALDHVPVILLTARASGESRLEGLGAEADDYLTKPFDARELLARVRNLIAGRQRLKRRYGQEITIQPSGVTATSADAVFLESVRAAIEARLSDADFSVEALAEAVALSPSQLGRRLKTLMGLTPVQLVLRMRLERAASLLAQGAGSVSEIAYGVGFNAHAYFAQRFREHYGVTPSAWAAGRRRAPTDAVGSDPKGRG